MSRRDDIENVLGMIDDDIVSEYADRVGRRKKAKSARMAVSIAAAAVLLSVPLALGVLNREKGPEPPDTSVTETPVTDVQGENDVKGSFSVLTVTAVKTDDSGFILGDTSFLVRTENGSVDRVRAGLSIEPALEYTVRETEKAECFEIVLEESIPDNTVIRLSHVEDQVVTDSWAFQTREILSVAGTFPKGGTMNCDVHTTVEIEFTYASAENVEDHVTFEPQVDGEWTHVGKTWRFTPDSPLEDDTAYTVTVSPGISAVDEVIESEYVFTFGTFEKEPDICFDPVYAAADRTLTARPDEKLCLSFIPLCIENNGGYSIGTLLPEEEISSLVDRVKVYRFENVSDYTASASGNVLCESEPAGELGHTVARDENGGVYTVCADGISQSGYYFVTAETQSGTVLGGWYLQINPVSAFVMTSADDLVLWVNEGGELSEDVPVTLRGREYRTDENGLLLVDLDGVSSLDGEYLLIGDGNTPLAVGIKESERTYPCGYIYADKVKYRPDETVNIWGYIPWDSVFSSLPNEYELVIGDGYGYVPVTVDENGTFSASYKLDRFNPMELYITLRSGDVTVARRRIEVAQYEDQNYRYEVKMEKSCVLLGESIVFEVKVSHISGVNAALRPVKAEVFGKSFFEKTDKNGVARFEISSENYERSTSDSVGYFSVSVYNATAAEYISESVWSGNGYIILASEEITLEKDGEELTVYVNETVPADTPASMDDLLGERKDLLTKVNVYERVGERFVKEYVYDPYTKKNVPQYDYKWSERLIYTDLCHTEDGTYILSLKDHGIKKDTKDTLYRYYVTVNATSTDGQPLYERSLDYSFSDTEKKEGALPDTYLFRSPAFDLKSGDSYLLCDYRIQTENGERLREGENVPLTVVSRDGTEIHEGRVLRILYQNEVISAQIFDWDEDMSFAFHKDMFPAVGVACVYLKDGELISIPSETVLVGTEGRDVNVDITTDSDEYAPGDQVTVQITVTDENGGALPDMAVNMSLMNSAAATLPEMGLVASARSYYSFDSYVYATGGGDSFVYIPAGWGGGGGVRSVFCDAPYFGSHVTDSEGKVTLTFNLPDNITEYTVSVHTADADRRVGEARGLIKVTKDFFVQHIPHGEVKSSDDLVVNAVVNSENMCKASCVISIKETGQSVTVTENSGSAFEANFGKLEAGSYTVSIIARSGDEEDSLEYTVEVVDSVQRYEEKDLISLTDTLCLEPVANPVELEVSTGAYLDYTAYYSFILKNSSDRTDTLLALYESRAFANKMRYGSAAPISASLAELPCGDNGILLPLEDAREDAVLTAISMMSSPELRLIMMARTKGVLPAPQSLTEAAELLLLGAVCGEAVLKDLTYMAQNVENDDYIELVLALGFIASGDYGSAREMYAASEVDPGHEGYAALRALCATYIDKENAKEQIDSLIDSSPSEYYLSIAVMSYMKNKCGISENEESVSISCGDFEETITLRGLETKKLTIVTKELSDVILEPHTEGICVSYTYTQSIDGVKDARKDITASLESFDSSDVSEGVVLLTLDLSSVDMEEGMVRIALPASLAPESIPKLPYGYRIVSQNSSYIEIAKLSRADCERVSGAVPYGTEVTIPLIVRSGGNYTLESVVFVSYSGELHMSEEISFDLKTLNKYGLDKVPVRPRPGNNN